MLIALVVGLAVAGCSDNDRHIGSAPLPSVPSGDRLCDVLPKTAANQLLGDTPYETSGLGVHKVDGELHFADCRLVGGKDNADVYVSVHVTRGHDSALMADPRVKSLGADVADLGTGFVAYGSKNAWAGGGVVRQDRTYQISVKKVSDKRDPRTDAVALLHRVVAILDPVKKCSLVTPAPAVTLGLLGGAVRLQV